MGEGFVTRVVVGALDVRQRAGRLDELGFRRTVTEYVEPPAQAIALVIAGSGTPAPYPKFANTTKPVT